MHCHLIHRFTPVYQCLVILLLCFIMMLSPVVSAKQFRAMLFTKTLGWHHESIHDAVTAMRELSEQHYFDLEWHEDASRINEDELSDVDVLIFASTSGNILNDEQQAAVKKFINSGKGFVGIHGASATEDEWDWYGKLIGHRFIIHPKVQTARVNVLPSARSFPGLSSLPDQFLWTDEWYDFGPANSKNLQYLLTVDESTYDTKSVWSDIQGNGMGEFHPIAWYQYFDGGRSFYSALGHTASAYQQDMFRQHLFGGIFWAATGKGISEE